MVAEPPPPPASDRRLALALGAGAVGVVLALMLALGTFGRSDGPTTGTAATTTTVDLAAIPNDELERVVAEHPEVVPMRLRLVERYLRSGELEAAQRHAEQAALRSTTTEDRARALRYLGWTTALLGEPQLGEGILVQSLALVPDDRDALYFLGRVRFEQLDRPDLAIVPLEQLLNLDLGDQRERIETLYAEVQVALGAAALVTTTLPSG